MNMDIKVNVLLDIYLDRFNKESEFRACYRYGNIIAEDFVEQALVEKCLKEMGKDNHPLLQETQLFTPLNFEEAIRKKVKARFNITQKNFEFGE